MNPANHITRPRRPWADRILIVVFVFLLWAPTLDSYFGLDHSRQPGENRLPAQFPIWPQTSLGEAQTFIGGLENYFNDHFGFRNKLIRWFQNWKIGLFHDRSVYNVIPGQNHWLFASDLKMIEHYLGMQKFTPEQLRAWQNLLEKRRDWLAQRGIKYLFVIPPDKQTIYPEELPQWLLAATPTNRTTKLDQFLQYMGEHSTVEILDLRRTLTDAKKIRPTYLQNDTHWNLFGSFIACKELVRTQSRQFPDLPPLDSQDFTWTNAPAAGGDLARMIGSDTPDQNQFRFTPSAKLPALKTSAAPDIVSALDPRRKGVVTENPGLATRTAVIFNDSYGDLWQPFLGYSFEKVVYLNNNLEFNPGVIVASKPDIVINEMLERYFNTQSPRELMDNQPLP